MDIYIDDYNGGYFAKLAKVFWKCCSVGGIAGPMMLLPIQASARVALSEKISQFYDGISNYFRYAYHMKLSWHGNTFCITSPLEGKSSGRWWFPSQSTSYVDLWCSLCSFSGQAVKQTFQMPMSLNAMTLMWNHHNPSFAACSCNGVGSTSTNLCNAMSGQCNCKPGVMLLDCSQCQVDYYNFDSGQGCTGKLVVRRCLHMLSVVGGGSC